MTKIVFLYDYIKPELYILIDGVPVQENDIYGFLYPVKNYILQTWLQPNGSWTGLAEQIKVLARGGDVQIDFIGREIDYNDVMKTLENQDYITTRFREFSLEDYYKQKIIQFNRTAKSIIEPGNLSDKYALEHTQVFMKDVYPNQYEKVLSGMFRTLPSWYKTIANEKDFKEADKTQNCCCIAEDSYLDSYDKLTSLTQLLRSLRKSEDMICCCISDDAKREEFHKYANQVLHKNFNFTNSLNSVVVQQMQEKFGTSISMRERISDCFAIKSVLDNLWRTRKFQINTDNQEKWFDQNEGQYNLLKNVMNTDFIREEIKKGI